MADERSRDEFGEFVAEFGPRLLRFAFVLTGGEAALSEDLTYEVLADLTARGLDGIVQPHAYARKAILNRYRAVARRSALHRAVLPRVVASALAERDGTPEVDDRLTLLSAMGNLSGRERAVMVLRYLEDLPDDLIAAELGCSRATVRSLAHRGLPKLRAVLAGTYGPGSDQSTDTPLGGEGSG